MEPTILVERQQALLTVTLNRPEKANALSLQMLCRLTEVIREAAGDETLCALVVKAAGGRVFSAGADLSELHVEPDDLSARVWDDLAETLDGLPILSVALVNGPCIGGGMTLALGCDIRIGAPETTFQYPALKNRVVPGDIDVKRLRALVGPGRMSLLLLGGQSVNAETALSWGLLDQITERSDLPAAADAIVETMCATPRAKVVEMKRLCRDGEL